MDTIKTYLTKYREVISYLFWGVMTTVVSWGSYSIFVLLLQRQTQSVTLTGIDTSSIVVAIANVLSWICAVIFAYITNKLWVFQSKSFQVSVVLPELAKFLSARIVTGLLEIFAAVSYTHLTLPTMAVV